MKRLMTWLAPPILVGMAISVGLAQDDSAEPQPDEVSESAQGTTPPVESSDGSGATDAHVEQPAFEWPLFKNLRTEFPEFREWLVTKGPASTVVSADVVATAEEAVEPAKADAGLEAEVEGRGLPAEDSTESTPSQDEQAANEEPLDWESNVATREQSVARLSEAIARQLKELEEREKKVQALFAEAEAARLFAEESCGGPIVSAPTAVAVIPPTAEEQAKNLELVLNMLKKMKPAQVAKLMGEWDDALVIRALKGLGGRSATPIVSKMPIDTSSRIMRRIATGRASVRLGEEP